MTAVPAAMSATTLEDCGRHARHYRILSLIIIAR
jgi:hypothetical protein